MTFALAADDDIEYMRAYTLSSTTAINLTGNGLAQTIIGNAGNNILSDGSSAAADTLQGGAGNDTYIVRHACAIIVETAGEGTVDRVRAEVSFSLAYDDDIERFEATQPAATSAINLTGNVIAQTIIGNAGANRIDGRGASDTLTGVGGDDTFVFSTTPGAGNIDLITDFGEGDDVIELDDAIFTALTAGALAAEAFAADISGQASSAAHRAEGMGLTSNLLCHISHCFI